MKRLVVVLTAVLAVALLPSCSSTSGICEAVKAGQDPVQASGSGYVAASTDQKREQAEKLRAAAEEIRSSCPEQSNAAARLESVADSLRV